jgi:ferredoxin
VCVPECPVDAIVADNELETKDFDYWLQKNKELAEKWPVITKSKDPLPEAEEYKDIEDKKDLLEE